MRLNGPIFESVIDQLPEEQRKLATENAAAILGKILKAYQDSFSASSVGAGGSGTDTQKGSKPAPTGLIYGRIQSGKTRAMITTAALAFDNRFRIVVVLTTDINRLVDQTHADFIKGIPNATIIYKDDVKADSLEGEAGTVAESLEYIEDFGVVIVCSKGAKILAQVIEFLKKVGGGKYPTLILDDEGDQATIDTKTRERSKKGDGVKPSTIHSLVHDSELESLRDVAAHNVFVSVTGTPQALVLQNLDSKSRPSFIQLLEADPAYTGADVFFTEANPQDNKYITLTPEDERLVFGDDGAEIPEGLKKAVCFFIVAATAAGAKQGWADFKMLCHPSRSTNDHGRVKGMLHDFVHKLAQAIRDPQKAESKPLITLLEVQYRRLQQNSSDILEFDELLKVASKQLARRKMIEINKNTTGSRLGYVQGYNFVVGGNSVGRGLAFTDLLVTYYVREAKITNMDTMFQHARMFGYRRPILEFVQIFMPVQLYTKFFGIAESDKLLREFISERGNEALAALVKTRSGLRPTSPNRLDSNNTKTLLPGSQLYPNLPVYEDPAAGTVLSKIHKQLARLFPDYQSKGKDGATITVDDAIKLIKLIRSARATNKWQDRQVPDILRSISAQTGKNVILKFRTAKRGDSGGSMSLPTGVLGEKLNKGSDDNLPILWVFDVEPKPDCWAGVHFAYPTLVWPKKMDPWVFNRS